MPFDYKKKMVIINHSNKPLTFGLKKGVYKYTSINNIKTIMVMIIMMSIFLNKRVYLNNNYI